MERSLMYVDDIRGNVKDGIWNDVGGWEGNRRYALMNPRMSETDIDASKYRNVLISKLF